MVEVLVAEETSSSPIMLLEEEGVDLDVCVCPRALCCFVFFRPLLGEGGGDVVVLSVAEKTSNSLTVL